MRVNSHRVFLYLVFGASTSPSALFQLSPWNELRWTRRKEKHTAAAIAKRHESISLDPSSGERVIDA